MLTVARGQLAALLKQVTRVVEARNTMPILSTVRLVADDGKLTATATDLDIEVAGSVPCDGSVAACIDAKLLAGIVNKLPDGAVAIAQDGASVTVKSGRSRFTLQALPVEDFPTMDAANLPTVLDVDLAALCEPTRFAISNEETRYFLNGVYLHVMDGTLMAVATDGHRMAMHAGRETPDFPGIILPRKFVETLPKGTARLELSDSKVRATAGDVVVTSKLIDGRYPDYQRVVPRNNDKHMTVDRDALIEAVERVSVVTSERGRAVKLDLAGDSLALSVISDNSAVDELAVSYDNEPMTIGFNSSYVLDALRAFSPGEVRVALGDSGMPALITGKDEGLSVVLMPMRV